MENMKTIRIFIFSLLISLNLNIYSQSLKDGFARLEGALPSYTSAQKNFSQCKEASGAAALYGLSIVYSKCINYEDSIESAYYKIYKAIEIYNSYTPKEKEKVAKWVDEQKLLAQKDSVKKYILDCNCIYFDNKYNSLLNDKSGYVDDEFAKQLWLTAYRTDLKYSSKLTEEKFLEKYKDSPILTLVEAHFDTISAKKVETIQDACKYFKENEFTPTANIIFDKLDKKNQSSEYPDKIYIVFEKCNTRDSLALILSQAENCLYPYYYLVRTDEEIKNSPFPEKYLVYKYKGTYINFAYDADLLKKSGTNTFKYIPLNKKKQNIVAYSNENIFVNGKPATNYYSAIIFVQIDNFNYGDASDNDGWDEFVKTNIDKLKKNGFSGTFFDLYNPSESYVKIPQDNNPIEYIFEMKTYIDNYEGWAIIAVKNDSKLIFIENLSEETEFIKTLKDYFKF
jgi:hypothetical protein